MTNETHLAVLHVYEDASLIQADAKGGITKTVMKAFEKHYGDKIPAECAVSVRERVGRFGRIMSIYAPVEATSRDNYQEIVGKGRKNYSAKSFVAPSTPRPFPPTG